MGPILAAGSEEAQLIFWDIRMPKDPLTIFYKSQTDDIMSVILTSNNYAISGSEDLTIAVFNLTEKDEESALDLLANPDDAARRLFSLSDNYFGYEGSSNVVGIYNIDSGVRSNFYTYQNTVR